MGCRFSMPSIQTDSALKRSRAIDKEIRDDCRKSVLEAKLLLLGAGEAGKSTLMKQIKIIHGSGYSEEERLQHRPVVLSNTLQSLQTIVRAMGQLGIGFATQEALADARCLFSLAGLADRHGEELLPPELASAMLRLSADPGLLLCLCRRSEYRLNDSAEYLLGSLERICSPAYAPTESDVLRARVCTRGIAEAQFESGPLHYRVLDVGGLNGERKKWIHCFEGVAAFVFVAALSEYAQQRSDGQEHPFSESLRLFDSVCACRWFDSSQAVLLLNKTDLFRNRLAAVPLNVCFPDYTGPNEFGPAAAYIRLQFERLHSRRRGQRRAIYAHFVCAVDTQDCRRALQSAADAVLKNNLNLCSLA